MTATKFDTVKEYLDSFPPEVRSVLHDIQDRIRAAIPHADEIISYDIPAFRVEGHPVVYFAAWKDHVSVYPVPDLDEETESQIAPYRSGKGTLRFPLGEPVPLDLVEKVAALLAEQSVGR